MRKLIQAGVLAAALGTAVALAPGTAQAAQPTAASEWRFETYSSNLFCNVALAAKRAAGYQTDPPSGGCWYSDTPYWYYWYCYPQGAACPWVASREP
ncbi:hypothetical protein ACIBQ1_35470 [Nonomuraea sp. NPDC050153]|uniref:hypothetical protein n=1 Tax=Nonomuraea sp. NPDC050153 TaxID=3364359 RepID=UPI00378FA716